MPWRNPGERTKTKRATGEAALTLFISILIVKSDLAAIPPLFLLGTGAALLFHVFTDRFRRGQPVPTDFDAIDRSFANQLANKIRGEPAEPGSLRHRDQISESILERSNAEGLLAY